MTRVCGTSTGSGPDVWLEGTGNRRKKPPNGQTNHPGGSLSDFRLITRAAVQWRDLLRDRDEKRKRCESSASARANVVHGHGRASGGPRGGPDDRDHAVIARPAAPEAAGRSGQGRP